MSEKKSISDAALLRHYMDELSAARSSVQELNLEIQRTRQDARTDGFNMEALDQLATAIAKSPHDDGAGLVRDTVKYARMLGLDIGPVAADQRKEGSQEQGTSQPIANSDTRQGPKSEETPRTAERSATDKDSETTNASEPKSLSANFFQSKRRILDHRGETLIHAALGIAVCWLLIELLR